MPDADVEQAVQRAIADGSWGMYHGPHTERLAAMLASMHGVEFAYPCCSGTFAVELALRGVRVEPDDEVVLAGYDFSGNFRAIEAIGARPVLVDIRRENWCLDAALVEDAIGPRTRAILASHLHGGIAPLPQLREIADRRGVALVEDACQAPGATIHGRAAGTWGDVGVFSFGGSKLLTAGRGGAIITRDAAIHQRAKIYCEQGNHAFAMSQLQAAVLPPQLDKLAARNEVRRQNVQCLRACLEKQTILEGPAEVPEDCVASYFKVPWLLNPQACGGHQRQTVIDVLQAEGLPIDAGFRGFHRRPDSRCRKPQSLTASQKAAEQTLLLHHPVLLEDASVIVQLGETLERVMQVLARLPVGLQGG